MLLHVFITFQCIALCQFGKIYTYFVRFIFLKFFAFNVNPEIRLQLCVVLDFLRLLLGIHSKVRRIALGALLEMYFEVLLSLVFVHIKS